MSQQPAGKREAYEPNRSCERCRSIKIRCLRNESSVTSTCQRCARLNVECVYALPAKRRPRKRTDTKVAELEKEVRALSSILRKQHQSSTSSSSQLSNASGPRLPTPEPEMPGDLETQTTATQYSSVSKPPSSDQALDIISSGFVSYEVAYEIFDHFLTKFSPRFPVVAFAPDVTIDDIRISRPMLFLAIIATASMNLDPIFSQKAHEKLASVLALQSMVIGLSSLDLLQALLVTTVWYHPGQSLSFDQLKYQQYSHMVAGVASQIGIEKQSKSTTRCKASDSISTGASSGNALPANSKWFEDDELELQRTLLSCYLLCSGISRSLHRPTIFPFTRWMSECLESLETSPLAAYTDKTLCQWVRLQYIMTESSVVLGVDDPSVSIDVSEPRVQHILQTYDGLLDSWYLNYSRGGEDVMLRFVFQVNRACLHEVAMYSDHDPEDFKPPFTIDRISRPVSRKVEWTAAHVRSLSLCWSHTCASLDLFLDFPVNLLRSCPDITFIRLIYCIVVLLKLSASATIQECALASSMSFANENQYGRVVSYIERVISLLKSAAERGHCPMAGKFSIALQHVKTWTARQAADGEDGEIESNLLEPLRDLSLHDDIASDRIAQDPISVGRRPMLETTVEEEEDEEENENQQSFDWSSIGADIFGDQSQSFLGNAFEHPQSQYQLGWENEPNIGFDPTVDFTLQPHQTFDLSGDYDFDMPEKNFDSEFFEWANFDGKIR